MQNLQSRPGPILSDGHIILNIHTIMMTTLIYDEGHHVDYDGDDCVESIVLYMIIFSAKCK